MKPEAKIYEALEAMSRKRWLWKLSTCDDQAGKYHGCSGGARLADDFA